MQFVALLLILISFPAFAEQQGFDDWLADLKREALSRGIDAEVVDDAFDKVDEPSGDIVALDHKQPEHTQTFTEYSEGVLTARRIKAAKEAYYKHRKILKRVEAKYHVPAPILIALWSVESNLGEHQGDYSVIESLATLAYDGRRSQFFRGQLFDALRILQDEDMSADELTGSWAGAMGQTQFMPSNFLKFAVDFDGEGKRDIWNNDADALASIANYLHSKGWNHKAGWGMAVALPDSEDVEALRLEKSEHTLKEWNKRGFRQVNGKRLPRTATRAHLVVPDDAVSTAYLAFPNYNILMDWNHSIYFATTVGLLADAVGKK